MNITPQQALHGIVKGQSLPHHDMTDLMRQIMNGEVSHPLLAALMVAWHLKGESATEIAAAAQVMRQYATPVQLPPLPHLLDIVGTGGDGAHTFNISTCAMLVASAAGAHVSKHGGRSVSSKSGSADVLEALGVNIDLPPAAIAQCMLELGVGFMFAPNHHPAMKHVAPVRRELGIKTLFNLIGPLANPANAPHVLLGVYSEALVSLHTQALLQLGVKHALVVHGCDGLDELTLAGPSHVSDIQNGQAHRYQIHPQDFGLQCTPTQAFAVDTPQASCHIIRSVLSGQAGPAADIVALNAGAALYAADIAPSIAQGIDLAKRTLASGAALHKLDTLVTRTQQLGTAS